MRKNSLAPSAMVLAAFNSWSSFFCIVGSEAFFTSCEVTYTLLASLPRTH
jgi:hypothetical protein